MLQRWLRTNRNGSVDEFVAFDFGGDADFAVVRRFGADDLAVAADAPRRRCALPSRGSL